MKASPLRYGDRGSERPPFLKELGLYLYLKEKMWTQASRDHTTKSVPFHVVTRGWIAPCQDRLDGDCTLNNACNIKVSR